MDNENFLARMQNIFQPEPIPMSPMPSIVTADEDTDVWVDPGNGTPVQNIGTNGAVPNLPQMSVPNPGLQMSVPPEAGLQQGVPAAVMPNPDMPSPGMMQGMGQLSQMSRNPSIDGAAVVPPMPGEHVPLPVVNMGDGVPPVESGVPPVDPADIMQNQDLFNAPNFVKASMPPGDEVTTDTTPDGKPIKTEFGTANLTLVDDGGIPNPEAMVEQDEAGAAATSAAIDNYMAPGEDGTPRTEEVTLPNGKTTDIDRSMVQEAAQKDPKGFSKAMNWFEKTFGITGQDLARFALFYAGSRLAGYSHSGSMSWAFQTSATFLQNRTQTASSLAQGGKYTAESIEKYRSSGDMNDLVLNKDPDPAKQVKTDYTKPYYKKGTNELVHVAVDGNSNKFFIDAKGKYYTGPVEDMDQEGVYRESRDGLVDRNKTIIDDHLERMDDEFPWFVGSSTEDAEVVQDRLAWWAKKHKVSLDGSVTPRVVGNAVRQAERWAAATGGKVESLRPFIDAQMMYMSTDNKWANQLHSGGEELQPDQILRLNDNILKFAMDAPGFDASKVEKGQMLERFMEYAWTEYQSMPAERKKEYEKRDGFYSFLQTEFNTTKAK